MEKPLRLSTSFYSIAKQKIAPIVKPLGFRAQGRFYYRITQNVVQQFCLLWLNRNFTIRFHLSSVFGENDRSIEGQDVTKLINQIDESEYVSPGQLIPVEPLQLQHYLYECANTCAAVLTNYLLPWFDGASDSASAYEKAKETDIFITTHQEPDSYKCLGFLLDMEQWEAGARLVRFYLGNNHLYNQKWWNERAQEYQQLYAALVNNDTNYVGQYMNAKISNI